MPRLVNAVTGVTVSVDDDTAANLGADWSPAKSAGPKNGTDEKPARTSAK